MPHYAAFLPDGGAARAEAGGQACVLAAGPEAGLLFAGRLPPRCVSNGQAHYSGNMRVSCAAPSTGAPASAAAAENTAEGAGGGGAGAGAWETCVSSMNVLSALPVDESSHVPHDSRGGLCLESYCPHTHDPGWARPFLGNYDGASWLWNFLARYAATLCDAFIGIFAATLCDTFLCIFAATLLLLLYVYIYICIYIYI